MIDPIARFNQICKRFNERTGPTDVGTAASLNTAAAILVLCEILNDPDEYGATGSRAIYNAIRNGLRDGGK